jgi:hypothetical protein
MVYLWCSERITRPKGVTMNTEQTIQPLELQHHEGARMIIDYCAMLAVRIGVNLKSVSWTANPIENPDNHTLTIEAESGAIKLEFAPRDITTFNARVGTEKTQKKLKKALFEFQTDS